jgi:uncharacterized protein
MTPASGLYVGRVAHNRMCPRRHRLSYRCYWFLLDLNEIPALGKRLCLFSHNRFNAFSIRDIDYGEGQERSLRSQVEQRLLKAGVDLAGGKILLLAMPRILGYAFNPISVYYCYRADGTLAALVYEVHNTFRQRYSYLIAVEPSASSEITQRCEKRFYVSPFLKMDLNYEFSVVEPLANVRLAVRASDGDQLILTATLSGRRTELTDANLIKVFFTHPLLTLKVIAAIHWEAVRLWSKGIQLIVRPEPPASQITPGVAAERGDWND